MISCLVLAVMLAAEPASEAIAAAPDYAAHVAPIFLKYCAGCHNDEDREGDFSLETYASLMKGSPRGPVFRPGDAAASRMIRQLAGQAKPLMPPKGEPRPGA